MHTRPKITSAVRSTKIFNKHLNCVICIAILSALVAACGGDRSSFLGDRSSFLMGGAIQGSRLSLSTQVQTIAGAAELEEALDGEGLAARFRYPWGLTTDGVNLYISEMYAVRKMNIATGQVTTLAGSGDSSGYEDGAGSDARFFVPRGITTDGRNVYLADSYNNTIRKIDIRTGVVSTLAGTAGINGFEDGIGQDARFNLPGDVTTDGENLYVTEPYSHTVRKIVISTGEVTTIAGAPGVAGVADGAGVDARFDSPYGIATDGKYLFVATPHQVRRITISSRAVTTLEWHANGQTSNQFQTVIGITTDGSNLYLTESNRTVRQLGLIDGQITTIAGNNLQIGSTDGLGVAALFNNPIGITTDGKSLYVADTNNHTIRKID